MRGCSTPFQQEQTSLCATQWLRVSVNTFAFFYQENLLTFYFYVLALMPFTSFTIMSRKTVIDMFSSSFKGYYSHRETINGSWYIQDLCEILRRYGSSLEFTEILTLVNRKVSFRSVGNCRDRSAIGKKQVPCFASMLTKKLFLRPKKEH